MTLLFSMLPYYLAGNLHCIGMCGPLVMMLGSHRYRHFYFLGRTSSFALTAMAAGEAGTLLSGLLHSYKLSAAASLLVSALLFASGFATLWSTSVPNLRWLNRLIAPFNKQISLLLLRDKPLATFLFGFFTVALPCGQTVVVFTACALSADLWIGFINGLAFALLTSPSLFIAMQAHSLIRHAKRHCITITAAAAFTAALLSLLRGAADLSLIDHMAISLPWPSLPHLVIY